MNRLETLKSEIHSIKVKINFERKYADRGGVDKLTELAKGGATQREVGDYFGMTPQRLSILYKTVVGEAWPNGPGPR